MQLFMTTLAVIAGMTFSLAIAVCVEEVVFGKVLRVMFKRAAVDRQLAQPVAAKSLSGD